VVKVAAAVSLTKSGACSSNGRCRVEVLVALWLPHNVLLVQVLELFNKCTDKLRLKQVEGCLEVLWPLPHKDRSHHVWLSSNS
jgi:hypothetical protein